jgi:S1-C subfamily serine protease
MNIIDVLIILLTISAALRGRELGFVRQLFSSGAFFVGLYIGALLQPHLVAHASNSTTRLLFTVGTTLGCGLILLALGEYVGLKLKARIDRAHTNPIDSLFGLLAGGVSLLLIIWLSAAILMSFPSPSIQNSLQGSAILKRLNLLLPDAPRVVASLGHLIDPNGFPEVFSGRQPDPPADYPAPSLGEMQPAVDRARASVVKIQGRGCGGIVEGSGFVVGHDLIATNAHVVAGIRRPVVLDGNGSHSSQVIWFDPDLDFAVLKVSNLAGSALVFNTDHVTHGTPAVVVGYPGGGSFEADPAAILDKFTAIGKNIYGQGSTERDVYEIAARVVRGNSGGPLLARDGSVLGVVFAESTTYEDVGYALSNTQVVSSIHQARAQDRVVGTGSCTE